MAGNDVPILTDQLLLEYYERRATWWKSRDRGFLTDDDITFLGELDYKNQRHEGLSPTQMAKKHELQKKIDNVMQELLLLTKRDYTAPSSQRDSADADKSSDPEMNARWPRHPVESKPKKGKCVMSYETKALEEVLVDRLAETMETFVEMFGEEYAIPLARALKRGLQSWEDKKEGGSKAIIDVSVTKR